MPLLTERASMDSFQLSYSEDDREEWPGLLAFEHVAAILHSVEDDLKVRLELV